MNTIEISIIIVSWNVEKVLPACLASIRTHTNPNTTEVIIVDNASQDRTVSIIQTDFPKVHLISNPKNAGFAAANNQGIAQAQGDYILLLNPDTELHVDTITKTIDCFKANDRIGIIGCRHLNPDQSLQPSVRRWPTIGAMLFILTKMAKLFPGAAVMRSYRADDLDYSGSQAVQQVAGSFFCIRRATLDQIGRLDEKFFIWFEEVDYCRRAIAAGWLVWYCAEATIVHHGGHSFNQRLSATKQLLFFKSAWHYFFKHGF